MKQLFIKSFFLLISLLSIHFSYSQSKVDWKEKDDFHKVMAQTFHPMEEGNYAPIKARSQEMYEKAVAWQKSIIPEGVNKKKAGKTLKKIVEESKELNDKIKVGATDAAIKDELTELHDLFHKIVGLCQKEEH